MKRRIEVLLAIVLVLGSVVARAYDLVVSVEVAETHAKLVTIPVDAVYPENAQLIGSGVLSEADSVFHFKDLPERPVLITWSIDDMTWMEPVLSPTDSLTVYVQSAFLPKSLNEIEVVGRNTFISDDKMVYLPTSQQKRISADGASLIGNMAIAQLEVSPVDGSITTLSGDAVATFIDYMPASKSDLINMRTSQVVRVEIFDNPRDPRFGGAAHVVNFITVKYEYGGYTKVTANQGIVNNKGGYYLFSRMAYRRMTYDVGGALTYSRSRHIGQSEHNKYIFPDTEVDYTRQMESSLFSDHHVSGFFRAVYQTPKTTISNIVGVNSSRKPHDDKTYNETFSSTDYVSGLHESKSNSSDLSWIWKGNYQFILPNSFSLVVNPSASYARYSNNYRYLAPESNIENVARDHAWSTNLYAALSKSLGSHYITMAFTGEAGGNNMDYYGTSPATTGTRSYLADLLVTANLRFGALTVAPSVGVRTSHVATNDVSRTEVKPEYYLTASYLVNDKNVLSLYSELSDIGLPVQSLAPNIQLTDQITAIKGNPDLKLGSFRRVLLQYQYTPIRQLSVSAYGQFNQLYKHCTPLYEPMVIDSRYVMLGSLLHDGFINFWSAGGAIGARLFDNSLNLHAGITFLAVAQHGQMAVHTSVVKYNFVASYSYRNMYAQATYISRKNDFLTHYREKIPQYYSLKIGWGNGDLNISATAYNVFNSSYKSYLRIGDFPNFKSEVQLYDPSYHRAFEISVVYSIGYGKKKVSRNDEVLAPTGAQSGLLK